MCRRIALAVGLLGTACFSSTANLDDGGSGIPGGDAVALESDGGGDAKAVWGELGDAPP